MNALALSFLLILCVPFFTLAVSWWRNRRRRRSRDAEAANEAEVIEAANEALGGAFEVVDGGKMKIPFGETPVNVVINGRNVRGLQRIDAQAGNEMLADLGGWIKRRLVGRPIFAGHPYHPDATEAAKWPDKRSRGSISEIEVANDGIIMVPKYNELGKGEVEDGQFMFHSPQWRLNPVLAANGKQEVKDGMPVFRPFSIHSAGLTNNPNIEVPPLVAANEDAPVMSIDLNAVVKALTDAGIIKEGDDESTILSAIGSLAGQLQWAREAKDRDARELALLQEKGALVGANEQTREELLESVLSAVQTMAANEDTLKREQQTQLEAANEQFKASRTAHVTQALNGLITGAKISKAKAEEVRESLIEAANEEALATALAELGKSKSKLRPDGGPTDQLAGAHKVVMAANEQASRSLQRTTAVHEALAEITKGRAAKPGDQEKAWNLAAARHPDLFKH